MRMFRMATLTLLIGAVWSVMPASAQTLGAQCSLGTDSDIDFLNRVEARNGAPNLTYVPFSITRAFAVGPGTFTANFNCVRVGSSAAAYDVQATALFIGS